MSGSQTVRATGTSPTVSDTCAGSRAEAGHRGDVHSGTGAYRELLRLHGITVDKAASLPIGTPASDRKGPARFRLV
jgi:hypothetical protein